MQLIGLVAALEVKGVREHGDGKRIAGLRQRSLLGGRQCGSADNRRVGLVKCAAGRVSVVARSISFGVACSVAITCRAV